MNQISSDIQEKNLISLPFIQIKKSMKIKKRNIPNILNKAIFFTNSSSRTRNTLKLKKNETDVKMNKSSKVKDQIRFTEIDKECLSIEKSDVFKQSFLSENTQLTNSKITLSENSNLRQKIKTLFLTKGM